MICFVVSVLSRRARTAIGNKPPEHLIHTLLREAGYKSTAARSLLRWHNVHTSSCIAVEQHKQNERSGTAARPFRWPEDPFSCPLRCLVRKHNLK